MRKSGRDSGGRFLPGCSGNAEGRRKVKGGPKPDRSHLIPVKRGGRTRMVDPKSLVMNKVVKAALQNDDLQGARLYLRELRLQDGQKLKREIALHAVARKPRPPLLYYEDILVALGVLMRNASGHIIIPSSVFADLNRRYRPKPLNGPQLRRLELCLDDPAILRRLYPNYRLRYKDAGQADLAREKSITGAFADYDAMMAEIDDYKAFKRWRSKRR